MPNNNRRPRPTRPANNRPDDEELDEDDLSLEEYVRFSKARKRKRKKAKEAYERDFQPGCVEATPWFWRILLGSIVVALAWGIMSDWDKEEEDNGYRQFNKIESAEVRQTPEEFSIL